MNKLASSISKLSVVLGAGGNLHSPWVRWDRITKEIVKRHKGLEIEEKELSLGKKVLKDLEEKKDKTEEEQRDLIEWKSHIKALEEGKPNWLRLIKKGEDQLDELLKEFPFLGNDHVREVYEASRGVPGFYSTHDIVLGHLTNDEIIELCEFLSKDVSRDRWRFAFHKFDMMIPYKLIVPLIPLYRKHLKLFPQVLDIVQAVLEEMDQSGTVNQITNAVDALVPFVIKYQPLGTSENQDGEYDTSVIRNLYRLYHDQELDDPENVLRSVASAKYHRRFQGEPMNEEEDRRRCMKLVQHLPREDSWSLQWCTRNDLVDKIQWDYLDKDNPNKWPNLIKAGIKPVELFNGFLTAGEAHKYLQHMAEKGKLEYAHLRSILSIVGWLHGWSDEEVEEEKEQENSVFFASVPPTIEYDQNPALFRQARIQYDWLIAKEEFLGKTHKVQQAGGIVVNVANSSHLDLLPRLVERDGFANVFPQGAKTSGEDVVNKLRAFHQVEAEERLRQQLRDKPDQPFPKWELPLHPRIKQIKSSHELIKEGNLMSHCVGGYVDKCLRGQTFIFHCGPDAPFGSTVEAKEENGQLQVFQNYGFKNSIANPECQAIVKEWRAMFAPKEQKKLASTLANTLAGRLQISAAKMILIAHKDS